MLKPRKVNIEQPETKGNLACSRSQFDLLRQEVVKIIQESKGMLKELGALVENNIGGYGQGNSEGPQGGNDQLGALKNIHEKTTVGCTLHHPNGEDALTRHGGGFIEDQIDTILLHSNVAQDTIPLVEDVLQKWHNLLNVSGGDHSLPKCKVGFYPKQFYRQSQPQDNRRQSRGSPTATIQSNSAENMHKALATIGSRKIPQSLVC
ncbi:predicted protein [Chaetoceros tenuissimus]|uniref:Uncharacterized protein n=1 Tax=Chaetoceros tenuissimus TaxID=426638 RepID=A0AAD3D3C6_9STRA|nr:predicted protein [Chaetoceros tenuissimus]